ncbi:SusE domain-containing protein [Lacihabitans sp. CS3-21]|uniref:SusE domain-containing protein n=1 Tax=Lacihabitans sp. CS3-21 TaxID=2487332 RepID=UPI0020CF3DCD|nr:SusE domain-containing protein [Lacihabitans sp. CS3-21]MCP9745080.1 SusF/SusE family outer membrane protein [Lacihabitans sp. CS3-21]
MNKIFKNIAFFVGTLILMSSCEKDEIQAVLNSGATPVVSLSAPTVVLSKDVAENTVLTITWQKPEFGYDAAPSYTILLDKKGGDFSKAYSYSAGKDLTKTFKGAELNSILLNLGLAAGAAADLDVKIQAKLSDAVVLTSPLAGFKATAYLDKLDLSSPWGVVGSAYNDWGAFTDAPFYKTSSAEVFVAYVTLKDGEFKIRKNNDWAVNYGDDGANGTLEAGGANIVSKAGTYKITFDAAKLTVKVEKYSWGLVGSAFNDWGATPDAPLTYDPFSDQWRGVVTLKDGEFKIRQNSDWAVNYGDDGGNGTIDAGGANVAAKKGTYLITVNFKENKMTVEKITNLWGIVGSGYNDWGATPDFTFAPDFGNFSKDFDTKGVWIAQNVTLKTGEIKFRANSDWSVNYGDDGANGTLDAGGANIAVLAGKYDVILDFSKSTPVYKITKK